MIPVHRQLIIIYIIDGEFLIGGKLLGFSWRQTRFWYLTVIRIVITLLAISCIGFLGPNTSIPTFTTLVLTILSVSHSFIPTPGYTDYLRFQHAMLYRIPWSQHLYTDYRRFLYNICIAFLGPNTSIPTFTTEVFKIISVSDSLIPSPGYTTNVDFKIISVSHSLVPTPLYRLPTTLSFQNNICIAFLGPRPLYTDYRRFKNNSCIIVFIATMTMDLQITWRQW